MYMYTHTPCKYRTSFRKVHKHACICTHKHTPVHPLCTFTHVQCTHFTTTTDMARRSADPTPPLPHVTSQAYRNPLSLHTLTHMYMYRHTQSTTWRIHSHFPLSLPLSHSLPLLLCRSLPCFLTSAIATLPSPSPTLKSALKCTRSL